MFSFITGKTKKIGLRMLPGVADFTCAHLKLSCLIVHFEEYRGGDGHTGLRGPRGPQRDGGAAA